MMTMTCGKTRKPVFLQNLKRKCQSNRRNKQSHQNDESETDCEKRKTSDALLLHGKVRP